LFLSLLVARHVQNAKLGRILVAMRDQENRVRFSGYDVASFKVFVFCLAAGLAGIGGALFTLQVGFMSPSFVGIVPSIEMVVFCALGGRYSLLGGVYGALLVNAAKSGFSESFPELWPYAMGALFIGVVLAFPNGLAGLYERYIMPLEKRLPVIGKYLDKDKPAPQAPPVVSDQLSAEKP
jgi:urea transport system permease protein